MINTWSLDLDSFDLDSHLTSTAASTATSKPRQLF
jgi:hypothetical protein